MWNLKKKTKKQMNLFPKQKETYTHRKQTYGYQRGKGGGERELRLFFTRHRDMKECWWTPPHLRYIQESGLWKPVSLL